MSNLEHCQLAYDGKTEIFIEKVESNKYEDLSKKLDQSGRSALHWACVGAKKDIVEYLHATYNVPLDDPDDDGWTPLMIASSVGSVYLVKFLLENKCNPNSCNQNKQRALHYACSKNHVEVAKLLLEKGADCNAVDRFGATALHRAASKGNIKLVDLLVVYYKANVNIPDIEGNTPLHLACEEERVEACRILLKHGANPYAKNKEEKTPVDISNSGILNLLSNLNQEI